MAWAKHTKLAAWLLKILLGAFVVILVLLPVHAFISTWGGTAIGPLLVWKSWKEILLALLVPLVIWYCLLRPDVAKVVWRHWLTKLVAVYVVVQFVFAIVSHASTDAALAGFLMNVRFFGMLILGMVLLASGQSTVNKIKKWLPAWLMVTTVIISILAILQVTVIPRDFLTQFGYNKDTTIAPYLEVDQSSSALRAFATMRGPNPLGAYLLLPLALAVITITRQRRNWLAWATLIVGAIALILTSSRSAWLGALAGLAVLAIMLVPKVHLKKWVKLGAVPALIVLVVFGWLAVTVPQIRLAVFHSRADRATLTAGSSDQHWQKTIDGIKDVAAHPFGQGVGTAGPASFYNKNQPPKVAENYFVQIGQETGLIGLALFVTINCFVAYQLWRQRADTWAKALLASFVGITVVNFFLHGWADDPTAMTWWGIAGLYLFEGRRR
jgi:hypothetical protein